MYILLYMSYIMQYRNITDYEQRGDAWILPICLYKYITNCPTYLFRPKSQFETNLLTDYFSRWTWKTNKSARPIRQHMFVEPIDINRSDHIISVAYMYFRKSDQVADWYSL
jgi:hypothetical protein